MAGSWGQRGRLAVAAGTVGALVAAYSGAVARAADEPVEITFSYLWTGAEAEALEAVIADFNQSQDGVVVRGVSSPDFQAQLASMSTSEAAFDISDNFGTGVGAWAEVGLLEPLDAYIERDGFDVEDFPDSVMEQMRYEGSIYSMPIAVHTQVLLYNRALFAEAGITEPPETLEEWADAIAATTHVASDGTIEQLGYHNAEIGTSMTTLGMMFGGSWIDDNGVPTPTDAGNLAGLQFYVDNITNAYGADEVLRFTSGFGEYASAQNPFFTGQVASVIDGEWQPVMIEQFAPDLDYGVAPLPYPADQPELAGTTQVSTSTLFIPSNAEHKDEAWEFMKYLLGSDGMKAFTRALGNLPARTSLLDDPVYDDIPNFDVWLDALRSENAGAIPSVPYIAEYVADLNTAFDDVVNGRATPEEAMEGVASRAEEYAG
jgi:multiple sugar transport system substrate-binding protein